MDEARDQLIDQVVDTMEKLWGGAGTTGILDALSSANLLDFTVPQACVLMFLRPAPQRMGRLAARLGTSLPSATSIANRLEQRGLIERVRDEADSRVVLCRLTPCGEERIDTLYEYQRTRMANILKNLGLGELGTIAHAFALLGQAMLSATADEGAGQVTQAT